jgi:hypothetical protein
VRTLHVDLADGADPHQTLWRIGYEILIGATSGTVSGCDWEVKEERPVPRAKRARAQRGE